MIYQKTWDFILELTRQTNQRMPLHIFCYCMSREDNPPINKEISEGTGINSKSVTASVNALQEIGLVEITTGKNGRKYVSASNNISSRIVDANDILYRLFNSRYEGRKADISDDHSTGFTLADVRADEDWKKAEPILAKYFKPFQYDPSHLVTKKQYFGPFVELVTDETIDFDSYCKWFRVEKYPTKKFVYGLFLHKGVITEYKNAMEEDESDRYSNTSKMNQSDSFKESVRKTNEFVDSLREDDDAD